MSKKRFRFISVSYKLISFILIILPAIGIFLTMWKGAREFVIRQAEREYQEIANCILHVVRARYDLVQNELFLEDKKIDDNLAIVSETLIRTARELELETARNNLNMQEAKEVFLAIVKDTTTMGIEVSVVSIKGLVVYSPQLPKGFDVSEYPWIQRMMENDKGNFRFSWRHPGEAEITDRVIVFRRIQGWDWILFAELQSLNHEKNEFTDHQYLGLNDFVTAYHAPAGGFGMILSITDNRIIAHPEMSGGSLDQVPGVNKMKSVQKGSVFYEDDFGVRWRAGVSYFAPRQWIIAVTAREDEIIKEVRGIFNLLAAASGILVLFVVIVFYRLQRSLLFTFLAKNRNSTSGK